MDETRINELKKELGSVKLVASTKYINEESMRKLYSYGIFDFAENRCDSLLKKKTELSGLDIKWHLIGHLQSNKVKQVINEIDFLHSLDSIKLAGSIEKYRDKPLDCFIELKLSESETKTGIKESELDSFLEAIKDYKKINVLGIMAMSEKWMNSGEKLELFKHAVNIGKKYGFNEFSIGMSEDYEEALEAGSTLVRLGRILYEEEDIVYKPGEFK